MLPAQTEAFLALYVSWHDGNVWQPLHLLLNAKAVPGFSMDLCCQIRSSARLGQSLRIPFRDDYIALHISVVASIIVATMVRALEIVLCGFYPGLPRFAIARRLLAWVRPWPSFACMHALVVRMTVH